MRHFLLFLLLASSPPVSAGYKDDVMEPWLGATQDELVSKWGYPQTANDLFKIDDETTIFTYRSFRDGFIGPAPCLVSFTIKKNVVTGYKYEGQNCPRIRR